MELLFLPLFGALVWFLARPRETSRAQG